MFLKTHDALMQTEERYAALPVAPLRVTAVLASPVVLYDPLHFDSLLSYAVVEEATQGQMLPLGDVWRIPLPLRQLWADSRGAPLWASTDMQSEADALKSVRYFHKRALNPSMTHESLRVTAGRHKELRRPMPTVSAVTVSADCIGNADEISRLLGSITSIGKKHAAGAGNVVRWEIDPLDAFRLMDNEGASRRPVPLAAVMHCGFPIDMPAMIGGWTPPYWLRILHLPLADQVPEDAFSL